MGSVKDLKIIEDAKENLPGIAEFIFSDRYSVFDWGEMPDLIENKGSSLCLIGSYFFEKMSKKGIKNHYIGVVENGEVKRINEIKKATNRMRIKLLRVFKPKIINGKYDYSIYFEKKSNFLIPVEVIYRNFISEGSSFLKRLREGKINIANYGLKKIELNQKLDEPIFEFSTKLEEIDRYIDREEVKRIAMISNDEIDEILGIAEKINGMISDEVEKIGARNEDGKIEFGMDEERNIIVVDVVGTPDECRFTINGIPISKEIARIYYRKTDWYNEIEKAKKIDAIGWRKLTPPPPLLRVEVKRCISSIYQAFCNEITGRRFFDVGSLKEIIEELRVLSEG
ncbi:MAG: phosphoribosylaminoimidazolesuccinocarboxamide synthase [Thermoplasmatales archaeon]|nr:phosphoribosylaminoimidazolesuccinocarboxamide synthase [Thermoplasmatales archaeon]